MILITGGGTGGHLSIAKALCEEYNETDIRPLYVGSTNGQDQSWFKGYPGFSKTIFLDTKGVVNKKFLNKCQSLFNIFKLTFYCKNIIKEYKVNKVFSVGGYAAAPASFAAILTRTPLYVHEQNAVSGTLNRLLKPFAKIFFSSYDKTATIVDYPVSKDFFNKKRIRKKLQTIIFLGGSQGAKFINNLAIDLALSLKKNNISIIHQCGNKDFLELSKFYKEKGIDVDLFQFSTDLSQKIQKADFAISRAGAGTLWELCANCIPCLFIPYPYAAKNHQYLNANFLKEKKLGYLIPEKEIKIDDILQILASANLKEISQSLEKIIQPNGAKSMIKQMQNVKI